MYNKKSSMFLVFIMFTFYSCSLKKSGSYYFDQSGISRAVLENYLDRSVTMVYFLVPEKAEGKRQYIYHDDDIRLIKNIRPKFIGRSIYRWGGEKLLNDQNFWNNARGLIKEIHDFDPEIIFQACLFEIVTVDIDSVAIPGNVFNAYGLPVEKRKFSYSDMLNEDGLFVNHWREGSSVPDISRLETQLWFYFLATSYIDLGVEAFHLGQIELIGMNDPEREYWAKLISKIRSYAEIKARRKWVLLDAHVPKGDMLKNGISLLDFNSFPLRIKEIPESPFEAKLEIDYLDGIYNKSKGGITPSGWSCENLPYLVEFDNYGRGSIANVADTTSHFVWGWDEISWFAQQSAETRNEWLIYAYHWIKQNDPNGHLQMPVNRMITCPNETFNYYRANTQSPSCLVGYSQEETIKDLWDHPPKY